MLLVNRNQLSERHPCCPDSIDRFCPCIAIYRARLKVEIFSRLAYDLDLIVILSSVITFIILIFWQFLSPRQLSFCGYKTILSNVILLVSPWFGRDLSFYAVNQ